MFNYIAYCRKSTDEKNKQVLSIEAQIAELKEFAQREKLEVIEYVTEAKTAKTPGREKFDEILRKIEKGQAQGILSWHPDRLARNSIDGGKIIYFIDTGKLLDLKFPSFWFDNTPQGKFMLNIAFGQSKYYVDNLSENVKRGNRQKLRRGEWPSKAPFGYINEPRKRTIEINPEQSRIIKKAFQQFASGVTSFADISRFLHKHGLTKRSGKSIHLSEIKRMLSNRFYIGILHYNGEFYQGSHKCFISKELFDAVQEQIHKIERPQKSGHRFPFIGLARCGECGAAITAEVHHKFYKMSNREANYIYYRCTKKIKPCTQMYITQEEFDSQLRKFVSDITLPHSWGKQWFEWMEKDAIEDKKNVEENILKLKLKSEELDKKLNLLLDGFLDGIIDQEIYKQKKNKLFDEKLKINDEIEKIKTNGSSWLEPMREFVISALQGQKIARAKNNCHDLSIMAKKVGSNFFLTNRRLSTNLNFPFAALSAEAGAASAAPNHLSISKLVNQPSLEPNTLYNYLTRVYYTFRQFNIQVPAYSYA